ncbi:MULTISPECIES: hypothetical protein [Cyanophyceae]|uniref:hypothetical protein n=1 Tax=Cyanophyceae TaxID=3028117 RepID=UPI00168748ED|nr:hypothetical protein [Trichocoleus sp. FACHB-40]MBD2003221.1 hypothetical protein [Trichocoleus sp. FACHB-40]
MKLTYDRRYNVAYIYRQEKTVQVETIQKKAIAFGSPKFQQPTFNSVLDRFSACDRLAT